MRYTVECYENQRAFTPDPTRPFPIDERALAWVEASPMLLVAVLTVEADSPRHAADVGFEIANAPWNPTDAKGFAWPHDKVRSMSTGDAVLVHRPRPGPAAAVMVAYACLWAGWAPVSPADLIAGAEAIA